MRKQRVAYWSIRGITILLILGLFPFGAWVGYERGYEAGWVTGHKNGVAFSKKAGGLSDEIGTGRVVPEER